MAAVLTLITLLLVQVLSAPAAAQAMPEPYQARPEPYRTIELVAPRAGQTVYDNRGEVLVEVSTGPPLQAWAGHSVQVSVDGRPLPGRRQVPRFSVGGIERGEHTLEVTVLGADGRALIATEPVTFHLRQASRLFPGRRAQ